MWNDGFEYAMRIGVTADGETLLAYLTRRFGHSNASEWAARIDAGLVLVDSVAASPQAVLRRGQALVWRRPRWDEPEAPTSFVILMEDDDILAIAKPAGLPTLPGANFLQTTLLHQVGSYAPGCVPVHRLGRWTSGVVLFGRTTQARAGLSQQWTLGSVGKRYRALAVGGPDRDSFTIKHSIGPVPHPLLGTIHAASLSGKPATSHATVVERRAESFLCDVVIATGRPHQIRIHLAAADHPLVGDPLYGPGGTPIPGVSAVPGDPGYSLHASELTFRHPRLGHEVRVVCEPPPELLARAQAR